MPDWSTVVLCVKCGAGNPADAIFCLRCNAPFQETREQIFKYNCLHCEQSLTATVGVLCKVIECPSCKESFMLSWTDSRQHEQVFARSLAPCARKLIDDHDTFFKARFAEGHEYLFFAFGSMMAMFLHGWRETLLWITLSLWTIFIVATWKAAYTRRHIGYSRKTSDSMRSEITAAMIMNRLPYDPTGNKPSEWHWYARIWSWIDLLVLGVVSAIIRVAFVGATGELIAFLGSWYFIFAAACMICTEVYDCYQFHDQCKNKARLAVIPSQFPAVVFVLSIISLSLFIFPFFIMLGNESLTSDRFGTCLSWAYLVGFILYAGIWRVIVFSERGNVQRSIS